MTDLEFLSDLRVELLHVAARHDSEPQRGSHRRPSGGWWRRRNLVIAIAAAAVLTGFVGAAHNRVFEMIGIDQPASGPTAEALVASYPWPHGLRVLRAQSRMIFQQQVPSAFDHNGPTGWTTGVGFIAPLSNGQLCAGQNGGYGGGWACTKPGDAKLISLVHLSPVAWKDDRQIIHTAPFVYWGLAAKGTRRITIVGPGNHVAEARLSHATLRDRVAWAFQVPSRMLKPGAAPTMVVARNASGRVIGREAIDPRFFEPEVYNRSQPIAPATHNPRPLINTGILLRLRVDDHLHAYSLVVDHRGQCLYDEANAEPVVSYLDCAPPEAFAPDIQTVLNHAAIGWGLAPRHTATVNIIYRHHTQLAVVKGGYYIFAVPTAQLRSADLPLRVEARDSHGAVIATHTFTDRSVFPGY